jgi:hypothetical protein
MNRSLIKTTLLFLLSVSIVLAWFSPNVSVDQESKPTNGCNLAAITLGPGAWSGQPLYVAFEDDSCEGMFPVRSDIILQKSTDAGRTWLPAGVLVHRGSPFATYPDIATDPDGNIYIVYRNKDSAGARCYHCVRSSDGGATWSTPACIDSNLSSWARIAADTAGNLFVAWTAGDVYSSVSTDKGMTWSPRVGVYHDTMSVGCWHADAYVQPGTNHYLVAAVAPYRSGSMICHGSYLYRSTDMGQTFEPGVRLDSFARDNASQPHVVADAQHVICDYSGGRTTEARTLYTQPDTWGGQSFVGESYYNGTKLAVSACGRVHTALMTKTDTSEGIFLINYASSTDHGVTWSAQELVNDDSTASSWNPDIAADSAGHAYVVWQRAGHVWFSTNNPSAGTAEQPAQPSAIAGAQVVSRYDDVSVEYQLPASARVRATLHDAVGRQVGALDAGEQQAGTHRLSWRCDSRGRKLSPGAYFVLLDMGKVQVRLKAVVR